MVLLPDVHFLHYNLCMMGRHLSTTTINDVLSLVQTWKLKSHQEAEVHNLNKPDPDMHAYKHYSKWKIHGEPWTIFIHVFQLLLSDMFCNPNMHHKKDWKRDVHNYGVKSLGTWSAHGPVSWNKAWTKDAVTVASWWNMSSI